MGISWYGLTGPSTVPAPHIMPTMPIYTGLSCSVVLTANRVRVPMYLCDVISDANLSCQSQ